MLAVGMSNGLFSIKKRIVKTKDSIQELKKIRGGTKAFFNRTPTTGPVDATLVVSERYRKLAVHDQLLKSFR